MGRWVCPPNMELILAMWFTIWSMARRAKFTVISSATGLKPPMAAPMETPMMVFSEMGVSFTRSSPNSARSPRVTLKEPSYRATSSPQATTDGSRRISSFRALFRASR